MSASFLSMLIEVPIRTQYMKLKAFQIEKSKICIQQIFISNNVNVIYTLLRPILCLKLCVNLIICGLLPSKMTDCIAASCIKYWHAV